MDLTPPCVLPPVRPGDHACTFPLQRGLETLERAGKPYHICALPEASLLLFFFLSSLGRFDSMKKLLAFCLSVRTPRAFASPRPVLPCTSSLIPFSPRFYTRVPT